MKISIVGSGQVGSLLAQYLLEWDIGPLYLANNTQSKTEGIILDTVSAFPDKHSFIHTATKEDIETSEVVVISAGPLAKANQSFDELTEAGLKVIKDFSVSYSFDPDCIVIITTTPIDEVSEYFQLITDHPKERVIGFGGSLDTARLRYLLSKELQKDSQEVDCSFIGIHGGRGLPIIREDVRDKTDIVKQCREYFSIIVKNTGNSSYLGPARQLAILVKAVAQNTREILEVSSWHPDYEMYVTWPAEVGNRGVHKLTSLKLTSEERSELKESLEKDRKRRKDLFQAK